MSRSRELRSLMFESIILRGTPIELMGVALSRGLRDIPTKENHPINLNSSVPIYSTVTEVPVEFRSDSRTLDPYPGPSTGSTAITDASTMILTIWQTWWNTHRSVIWCAIACDHISNVHTPMSCMNDCCRTRLTHGSLDKMANICKPRFRMHLTRGKR